MKNFALFIFAVLFSFQSNFYAQWVLQNGPYAGGTVTYDDGEHLWVGTDGSGMFQYNDDEGNWTKFSLHYPVEANIRAITKTDSGLIAGTSFGVYRFDGSQWVNINSDMIYINDFAVDSLGRIWAATQIGIEVSQDLGRTWTCAFDSLAGNNSNAIIIKDGIILIGTVDGVFRTTDWGETWERKNSGINYVSEVYDFVSVDNWIYMATWYGTYRTADYGDNWASRMYGLEGMPFALLSHDDYYIFAATDNGVYKSTLYDSEWMEVDPAGFVYKESNSLALHNNSLIVSTQAGIFKIDVNNTYNGNWVPLGLPISTTFKFTNKDDKVYAATHNVGIYETTDHGKNWDIIVDRVFGEGYAGIINDFASNSSGFFVAASQGFYRKLDTDPHWTYEGMDLDESNVTNVAASETAIFVSTGSNTIFYSISDGDQWHPIMSGLPSATVLDLAYCNNYVYAALANGLGIYKYDFFSNDSIWVEANNGLGNLYVNALYVDNNSIYAATNNGLYKSIDNGDSWTRIDNGINNTEFNSVYANGDNIYVGASYATVFFSQDGGSTWTNIAENLHSTYGEIVSVFADDSVAYVGLMGKGVWTRPLSEFVVGVSDEEIPSKFVLKQNYPNPFNPTTTIEYSIPNVGSKNLSPVQLKIYDVLGREITTLVNQRKSPGNYSVKFDASNLPSGTYFYTLRVGNFVSTKKMILMK